MQIGTAPNSRFATNECPAAGGIAQKPTNEYAAPPRFSQKPTNEYPSGPTPIEKPTNECPPLRRRGGQPGNRNALKTGYRTAEAKAHRAEWRLKMRNVKDLVAFTNALCRAAGDPEALARLTAIGIPGLNSPARTPPQRTRPSRAGTA